MNASVITALAALAGAAIDGLTSVFASWLAQHAQADRRRYSKMRARPRTSQVRQRAVRTNVRLGSSSAELLSSRQAAGSPTITTQ